MIKDISFFFIKMDAFFDSVLESEIGFIDPIPMSIAAEFVNASFTWIQKMSPECLRTIWFTFEDPLARLPTLPPFLKSRVVWMDYEQLRAWCEMGPFPALVTLNQNDLGPYCWKSQCKSLGQMEKSHTVESFTLWTWKSVFPKRRALMICHHCGVLPDLRRQLRIFGIQGDFIWLCDGKPPTGDAWPSTFEHFTSSIPLLQGSYDWKLTDELRNRVCSKYSLICTSHCMRYPVIFSQFGLPLLHINSTRFGNSLTVCPSDFIDLQKRIQTLLISKQLTVIHNNNADAWYAKEYLGPIVDQQIIRSVCDLPLRFRIRPPTLQKFLVWDTRNKLLTPLFQEIKTKLGSSVIASSELVQKKNGYLDDDFCEPFTAVIHIPYNISTMSCFEQATANIPLWLPTPRFLKEILSTFYSELSWYCFNESRRVFAQYPDQVWNRKTLEEYVTRSDFNSEILGPLLFFDSIDDLAQKLHTVNYDEITKKGFVFNVQMKLNVLKQYENFLTKALCI